MLHAAAREADGRADATPSVVVIDTQVKSRGGVAGQVDRGVDVPVEDHVAVTALVDPVRDREGSR